MSSSSSSPTNTTSTVTSTQETNLYDTGQGDIDVANSSGTTVNVTCEHSVADAAALGQSAVQANTQVSLSAIGLSCKVASEALDALSQTQVGSASLVEQAITAAAQETGAAFGASQKATCAAYQLADTAEGAEATEANAALTTVASAVSTNVATTQFVKYVVIGIVVIAVAGFAFYGVRKSA